MTRQGSGHPYDMRQGNQIQTNISHLNFVTHCLRYYIPSRINSTPPNILPQITTHSPPGFSINFHKGTIGHYLRIGCSAPSHYRDQWWLIVKGWTLTHKIRNLFLHFRNHSIAIRQHVCLHIGVTQACIPFPFARSLLLKNWNPQLDHEDS